MSRRTTQAPVCVQVAPFDLTMREEPEHADQQWVPFWAAQTQPLRMLTLTRAFDLSAPLTQARTAVAPLDLRATHYAPLAHAVDAWAATDTRPDLTALCAALPAVLQAELAAVVTPDAPLPAWQQALDIVARPLWRRPYLRDAIHWYTRVMAQIPLRALRHYLLAWPGSSTTADASALPALVAQTFDTTAWIEPVPTLWACPYTERDGILWPEDGHQPVCAILTAYDLAGTWASGDVLHRVLLLDLDLAIAIDVQPVSRAAAEWKAEWQLTVQENRQARGDRDYRADQRKVAAEELQALLDHQALHEVSIHLAVFAPDVIALRRALQQVRLACGSRMKLLHARFAQAMLAQFFGATPTRAIVTGPVVRPRGIPSHGVAAATPFGLRKPDRTDGILWMFQGDTPIFFDPFIRGRAGHLVMVGKTGFGKTFAINCWLLRLAAQGCRVVMMEPQGHSQRLVAAAHQGGARYALTLRDVLNPLDAIVGAAATAADAAAARATQIEHVITQLSVLLGQNEPTADHAITVRPKRWTTSERALLDVALQHVYAPYDLATMTAAETPTISALVAALRDLAETFAAEEPLSSSTARQLALELDLSLVRGSAGGAFNAPTTIDWTLAADITAYGLEGLPEGRLRTYYFGQIFAAINRVVRDPRRSRERPLIVVCDEFAFSVARIPALAAFAEMATRTWRTFNAAFWSIDQTAHLYLGVSGERADAHLLAVWQQSTIHVVLRQDKDPAERLGAVIEGMRPAHVQAIKGFNTGDALIAWGAGTEQDERAHELWVGHIEPTDAELRAFDGT